MSFEDVARYAQKRGWWKLVDENGKSVFQKARRRRYRYPPNPECGCRTHAGSHAEHIDKLDRAMNQKLLGRIEKSDDPLRTALAFSKSEILRLDEKLKSMKRETDASQAAATR